MSFKRMYLLHGLGGSPNGSVRLLKHTMLNSLETGCVFIRPRLPHASLLSGAEASVEYLERKEIPAESLLVGISLGGLVAAKLQEASRPDLHVIAISSPTWVDGVELHSRMPNRIALYSSADEVIAGRTTEWPRLAEAYDLPWLTHDTDKHVVQIAESVAMYFNRREIRLNEL